MRRSLPGTGAGRGSWWRPTSAAWIRRASRLAWSARWRPEPTASRYRAGSTGWMSGMAPPVPASWWWWITRPAGACPPWAIRGHRWRSRCTRWRPVGSCAGPACGSSCIICRRARCSPGSIRPSRLPGSCGGLRTSPRSAPRRTSGSGVIRMASPVGRHQSRPGGRMARPTTCSRRVPARGAAGATIGLSAPRAARPPSLADRGTGSRRRPLTPWRPALEPTPGPARLSQVPA